MSVPAATVADMNQRSLLEPIIAGADTGTGARAAADDVDVDFAEHDGSSGEAFALDGPQQRAVDHGEGALIIAAGAFLRSGNGSAF